MTKSSPAAKRGRPFDNLPVGPGTALGRFLIERMGELDITNQFVAEELGYARSSVVSSWKTARARFPLDNLWALSDILEVDPAYMLALYIDQYVSANDGVDHFRELHRMMSHIVTTDEWEIIKAVRKARRFNSKPMTDAQRSGVEKLFEEPITTPVGPYEPLEYILPDDKGNRRKFARRGHERHLSVSEIEEMEARKAAGQTKPQGKVLKRSKAAEPA